MRLRGIALDVALIHIASMSNLMAALGWALVDLLEHPMPAQRVASGDHEFAQRCALESTRLAQRSIMSRAVLSPVDLDTGDRIYRVPAGWTIATLLPLLNTSARTGPAGLGAQPLAPISARRCGIAHHRPCWSRHSDTVSTRVPLNRSRWRR